MGLQHRCVLGAALVPLRRDRSGLFTRAREATRSPSRGAADRSPAPDMLVHLWRDTVAPAVHHGPNDSSRGATLGGCAWTSRRSECIFSSVAAMVWGYFLFVIPLATDFPSDTRRSVMGHRIHLGIVHRDALALLGRAPVYRVRTQAHATLESFR